MIFVDTSFLYPLFSARDLDHERVRKVLDELRASRTPEALLTTDWVIAETITLIRMTPPRSHGAAVKAGEFLFSEALAQIHWVTPEEEKAAFAYFKKFQDKEYSFVDCLSFVVMEDLGLTEALSVDSDFTHRFVARPGPRPE